MSAGSGGDVKDGRSRGHGLKDLTSVFFGVEDYGIKKDFDTVDESILYPYAAKDGLYTYRLYTGLKRAIDANPHTSKLCYELLFPASIALADTEMRGIRFDTNFCREAQDELRRCSDDIAAELRDIAGDDKYNPRSPKQNYNILYNEMDLPPQYNAKTNRLTANADAVSALLDTLILGGEHPDSPRIAFLERLAEFRSIDKTIGTYLEGMEQHILDGHVFPSFNLHTVVTGRLSSNDPNAQNITRSGVTAREQSRLSDSFIRRHFPLIADSWATDKPIAPNFGKVIRQQFAPDDGEIILQVDYSQAELRVLCWAARDENMREAYIRGEDLHTTTAAAVFGELFTSLGKSDEDKSKFKELRTLAKTVNFGIPYGRGATAIAQAIWRQMKRSEKKNKTFKMVEAEAHAFVRDWFSLRPNVKIWQESTVDQAMRGEPIYTPFGRRRQLSVIPNRRSREFVDVKNHVMNFPIQSIASDCTLMSLVRIHSWMRDNNWWGIKGRIIATVHDSIVFSVKQQYAAELSNVVRDIMLQVPLDYLGDYVPFDIDFEWGTRWGNLEKFAV